MRPLFFNQNIAAKDPEKKIPSTAAKATTLSPKKQKVVSFSEISYTADICKLYIHTLVYTFCNNTTANLPRNKTNTLVR